MVSMKSHAYIRTVVIPGTFLLQMSFRAAGITTRAHASFTHGDEDHLRYSRFLALRQDPAPFLTAPLPSAVSTSSSFDYWWPYPASTGTSSATPTSSTSTDSDDDGSTSDIAPDVFASLTSALLPAYASVMSMNTTGLSVNANVTPSNDYSIITITALPPLTSSPSNPHRSHVVSGQHGLLNMTVLAPIFAMAGAALGVVFGWFAYGLYMRNRAINKPIFTGPEYSSVKHSEDSDEKDGLAVRPDGDEIHPPDESQFLLGYRSSHNGGAPMRDQRSDAGDGLEVSEARNGSNMHSVVSRSPSLSAIFGEQNKEDHIKYSDAQEGQEGSNWLLGSSSAHPVFEHNDSCTRVGRMASKSGNCISPSAPTLFESVASSDEDEDYELARSVVADQYGTGTLRQKSIRNKLIEKLQSFGTKGNGGHRQRGRTPELEEGLLLPKDPANGKNSRQGLTKTRSSTQQGGTIHGRAISYFTLAHADIQTPPATYAADSQQTPSKGSVAGMLDVVRAYTTPLRPSESTDKFTELPKRNRTGRRLQSSRKPQKCVPNTEEKKVDGIEHKENKFILPASPPSVTSPRLESELFFSPTPPTIDVYGSASSRQRVQNLREPPKPSRLYGGRDRTRGALSSSHQMIKEPSGLASYTEKALPATPPRRTSRRYSSNSPASLRSKTLVKQRERAATALAKPMSPKERYEARRSVHEKVGAIVSRSWTTRTMQGVPTPSSPTMFGAQVDEGRLEGHSMDSGLRMMSIEQVFEE